MPTPPPSPTTNSESRHFIAGMLAILALQSLGQDYIGKEEYIRRVEYCWAPAAYTVPLAIFILLVAVFLLIVRNEK